MTCQESSSIEQKPIEVMSVTEVEPAISELEDEIERLQKVNEMMMEILHENKLLGEFNNRFNLIP